MPRFIPSWQRPNAKLIVMHMVQERGRCRAHRRARRRKFSTASLAFFDARLEALTDAGHRAASG